MNFFSWLTLLLVYLKLTHQIDWTWPQVLLPLLAGLVLAILVKITEDK